MRTTLRMYVRQDGKRSHSEVLLTIDWDSFTKDDMRLMCSHYLAARAHKILKTSKESIPENFLINARDYIHNEPVVQVPEYNPARAKVKFKISKELKSALSNLSAAELKTLMEM